MSIQEKIEKALDRIRPVMQNDGGDIQFISWDDDKKIVKVRLMGACYSCPLAQVTLKNGVEVELKKDVPEIKEVQSV